MKIEIVVDPSRPLPLASRVAPAPVVTNGTTPAAIKYVIRQHFFYFRSLIICLGLSLVLDVVLDAGVVVAAVVEEEEGGGSNLNPQLISMLRWRFVICSIIYFGFYLINFLSVKTGLHRS